MMVGKRPPKSRLSEKAARAPSPHLGRAEKSISKYLEEVKPLHSEPARLTRLTVLLSDLFGNLDLPLIRDFLGGFETKISAHESEKCRVLRGRADALYGNLLIEFERGSAGWLKQAKKQLQRYLAILASNGETREHYFIPIASDGISFIVFAPKEGPTPAVTRETEEIEIEEVEEFNLDQRQPQEFYFWLDRYFLREYKREPRTENFLEDFGSSSPAFRSASSLWLEAIAAIRKQSDYKVIYENWRQYLRIAYGTSVGDEHLFVRHTYLATLAKLIAYIRITGAQTAPEEEQTQEIIQGTFFEKQQIMNFLEEDFFSWVARAPVVSCTQKIASRLANLLFTYQLRELSEDVLKELYQGLVDPKDRHDLGEYYTPDWLAARMCNALLSKSGEDAVLDPACGSGTFLYQAIQHKKKHLPATRQSLEKILGNVVGIDIHPLAVIISKMNVLLALGDLFQKRSGPVSIQVYLANSIRHPTKQPFIGNGGEPAEKVYLNEREVLIPDAALSSAAALDAAVRVADTFAKSRRDSPSLDQQAFKDHARRVAPELAQSPGMVEMLFDLAGLLHEFIRKPEDTIWAYILKNQYKPTFLTKQFDVVIGNPPWLSFRYVEKGEYQAYLKHLIVKEFGLLEGAGHLITHLELGTLFFARCATLYLKHSGKIGFVLPRSIFSADQHDRFRRSYGMCNTTLTQVWDLEEVSPLFNVPAAVAFGDVISDSLKTLPGKILSGQLKRKNASFEEAKRDLKSETTEFHVVQQGKRSFLSTARRKISSQRSFYQPHFKEGATIVPRNFWFVEFKVIPRLGMDIAQPVVATDPRAEAEAKQPYKGTHFEAAIEAEFLYATLLSTDLLPFGHFDFRPIVLPLIEDAQGYQLLTAEQARAKGYLKLPEWLDRAQALWAKKRKEKARKADLLSWLNYRNKLTDQNPKAEYVVLYSKSATFLCAAVLRAKALSHKVDGQEVVLQRFVADHVTYCFETTEQREANYLVALLNSPTIDALIKPMQARGLWGPRDIHKKVWELPIPEFNQKDKGHLRLAEIAEACAEKVMEMVPGLKDLFKDVRGPHAIGRARTAVREALKDELAEIDALVQDILK
jgi:type I restriction-modification system DNA methylase subunit